MHHPGESGDRGKGSSIGPRSSHSLRARVKAWPHGCRLRALSRNPARTGPECPVSQGEGVPRGRTFRFKTNVWASEGVAVCGEDLLLLSQRIRVGYPFRAFPTPPTHQSFSTTNCAYLPNEDLFQMHLLRKLCLWL